MTDNIKLPPMPEPDHYAFLDGGQGIWIEGGPTGTPFYSEKQAQDLMREAVRLNAQATSRQWPKPEDVTPEMLNAFRSAYKEGDFWRARIHGALCAMLSAAPAAPQPEHQPDDGML